MKEHPLFMCFCGRRKREMAGHTDGFESVPWNSITFIYKFHSHFIGQSLVRMGRETSSDRKGEEIIGNNITCYSLHSFPKYSLPFLRTQKCIHPLPKEDTQKSHPRTTEDSRSRISRCTWLLLIWRHMSLWRQITLPCHHAHTRIIMAELG